MTDSTPVRTAETYRLTVGGLVDRPATLTLADLQAMPQTSLIKDFQCVTGWRVPQVHWSGVALPDLLDHVGVQKGATALRFISFDGAYTESLTLAQAQRRDVLVALQMLGAPVTRDHGGPVRLYVAPMYGYKSCKWLGGIELAEQRDARVLGERGLRRRRLGRQVQRTQRRCANQLSCCASRAANGGCIARQRSS